MLCIRGRGLDHLSRSGICFSRSSITSATLTVSFAQTLNHLSHSSTLGSTLGAAAEDIDFFCAS